jgi:hypothetical protein
LRAGQFLRRIDHAAASGLRVCGRRRHEGGEYHDQCGSSEARSHDFEASLTPRDNKDKK